MTDTEGEPEADTAGLPLTLSELLGLCVALASAVAEAAAESDASALALRVTLTEPVAQAVAAAETEGEGDKEGGGEEDAAPEALVEGVELTELHGELVRETLAVDARVSVLRALTDAEAQALGEPAPVVVAPTEEETEGDPDAVANRTVPDTLGLAEGEALMLTLPEAQAVTVPTALVGTGEKEMLGEVVDEKLPASLEVMLGQGVALSDGVTQGLGEGDSVALAL